MPLSFKAPLPRPTIAPSTGACLASLIRDIHCPKTRQFLSSVLAEPEMELLSFTPDAGNPDQLPIQCLQQAARLATAWCLLARTERDMLFVATVLHGLHMRLPRLVSGDVAVADVLFTLVMPALHRLDDVAPAQASLLRHLMGWGNQDELDEHYLPQMLHAMHRALQVRGSKKTVLATPRLPALLRMH